MSKEQENRCAPCRQLSFPALTARPGIAAAAHVLRTRFPSCLSETLSRRGAMNLCTGGAGNNSCFPRERVEGGVSLGWW